MESKILFIRTVLTCRMFLASNLGVKWEKAREGKTRGQRVLVIFDECHEPTWK